MRAGSRTYLIFGTLLCLLAMLSGVTTEVPETKSAKIEQLITRYQENGYLNGAVLVAEHGSVLYAGGVGAANMDSHQPNTARTRFGIASITKQFTAVLVLQEVAKGRIRLDGRVSEYLPWYRTDTASQMTVEQLLRHTSGLPADFDSPQFSSSEEARIPYEPRAFVEKFCQPNLAYKPGTKWEYSNCGYDMLGLILERVTGKSYQDLLDQNLLEPLGMSDSGLDRNSLTLERRALGYERHPGPRYTPGPSLDRGRLFAGGGMYSTVEDLFRWNQALSRDQVLPSQIRARIFQPGLNDWAYGWFVGTIPPDEPGSGSQRAEMRGDLPGNYFSTIIRYPEQDAVIIVLRNAYGSPEKLETNLQAVLFGKPPRVPRRSPQDLAAHVCQITAGWCGSHGLISLIAILIFLAAVAGHRFWWTRSQHIGQT